MPLGATLSRCVCVSAQPRRRYCTPLRVLLYSIYFVVFCEDFGWDYLSSCRDPFIPCFCTTPSTCIWQWWSTLWPRDSTGATVLSGVTSLATGSRKVRQLMRLSFKPWSQLRFDYDKATIRRCHDAFDYDGSDRNYDSTAIRPRQDYDEKVDVLIFCSRRTRRCQSHMQ